MSMQKIVFGIALGCFCAMSSLTSCTDNQNDGIVPEEFGTVNLGVSAGSSFDKLESRAVDETPYSKIENYEVKIMKGETVVKDYNSAANLPKSIELDNGSYTVLASYGTEQIKSREMFLSQGSKEVNVQADNQTVQITCEPTCAKVKVNFAADMDKYFQDYQVKFSTKALKSDFAMWAKADTDPWYLLVDKEGEEVSALITLTPKDAYTSSVKEIVKTTMLKPNEAWSLKIAPRYSVSNGQLGIEITIDTTTNDHQVDIVVPSDWVSASANN